MVRRLGAAAPPRSLDGFRLGLAFMASAPRGQHELDFEAEEAAILTAVGESRIDLMVEDTGDPEQLGRRLGELGGMPVVHLSCHGVNNYPAQPGSARGAGADDGRRAWAGAARRRLAIWWGCCRPCRGCCLCRRA